MLLVLPPQSPRGFSALARLYYLARPTKTAMLRRLGSHKKICWTEVGFTTKQERVKKILPFVQLQSKSAVTSLREQLYEQMTSNPAFTEKNIQKDNAFLLDSRPVQKSLVTYHTIPSL